MFSIPAFLAWITFVAILLLSFIPFDGYKPILIAFLVLEFLKSRIIKLISLPFGPTSIAKFINNLGLEFVTVGSLVAGVLYGPFIGAAFGGICMLTHYLGRHSFSVYSAVNIPMYIIFGALAAALSLDNLLTAGIIFNIGFLIVTNFILFLVFHPKMQNVLFFAITNVFLNIAILNIAYPMIA